MKFADLPVVDHSTPGYERLWVLPLGWAVWEESDGRCYALTFDNRFGGEWTPNVVVAKEQIPRDTFVAQREHTRKR